MIIILIVELLKTHLIETQKELAHVRGAANTAGLGEEERDDFLEARIHFLRHQVIQ